MMNKAIKVIITKYWATKGPMLRYAEKVEDAKRMIRVGREVRVMVENDWPQYYHGNDWHETKRAATDDVLSRYIKRKEMLKKCIKTLDEKRDRALKLIEEMAIDERQPNNG